MTQNLGHCSLRKRKRSRDPMGAYDALPAPLRQWLAQAALPWSPHSARRIWTRCRTRGLTPEETLPKLSEAEARTLARDKAAINLAA